MIAKYKIKDFKQVAVKDQDFDIKMKEYLFYSSIFPLRNIFILGSMNAGKSHLCIQILKSQAHRKKTMIYWCSALSTENNTNLDPKVQNLIKQGYNVQQFTQEDIYNGCLYKILDYLTKYADEQMQKSQKKWKKIRYVKNFLVIDDCEIPLPQQKALKSLCRLYRHTQCPVINLQQDFVGFLNKTCRNLFNCQIIFGNQPLQRLKENIYKQLRDNISYDEFETIYKDCTVGKPHGFLLIDSFGTPICYQDGFEEIFSVGDSKDQDISDKRKFITE